MVTMLAKTPLNATVAPTNITSIQMMTWRRAGTANQSATVSNRQNQAKPRVI